jgi:hypothetical protein
LLLLVICELWWLLIGVENNVNASVDTMPKTGKKKTQEVVGYGRLKLSDFELTGGEDEDLFYDGD